MLEWNKKCVKVMLLFKNFRLLESIQGFFPTLFIIVIFNPSPFLSLNYLPLFSLFISIILAHQFVYIINDYYDYPTDSNSPRKGYTKKLSQNKRSFLIFLIILFNLFTFKIYSDYFIILALNSFFFFLGLLYSHPIPHFKGHKFLSLFTHFLYGFLGSTLGYFILKELDLIKTINPFLFALSGTTFGFLFLAGSIMSVILDKNLEPKSWLTKSASTPIKYYKYTLYSIIFLLFLFYLIQLKGHTFSLVPSFLFMIFALYKIFKKAHLCKRSQKASIFIRNNIRLYFFLFFLFQIIYKITIFLGIKK